MTRSIQSLLAVAMALTIFGCRCHRGQAPRQKPAGAKTAGAKTKVQPLKSRFSAEQDFAFVMPKLAPVKGVGSVRASDCGGCHEEIHREWEASTHAWALRDIQYQAELHKPSSPRWLCLNCHIPVQNQRRWIVTGLEGGDVLKPALSPNPDFDREMQQEAITCAVCHVRRDSKGRSQVVGARGNAKAPHPVKADRAALRKSCLRCHDPRGERITPLLVCWFTTREEVAKGPHGGKKDCVDCHMPVKERRLAAAFEDLPVRKTHAHHWVGGGVPKSFGGYDRLLKRGFEPGLEVLALTLRRGGERALGFALDYQNTRAGHSLPTADPERHLLLVAELRDAAGKRLGRVTERIGQTWKWSPRAEKTGDNRLAPMERRSWKQTLRLPAARDGLRLVVTVYHVRLTSENAKHMKETKVEEQYHKGIKKQVRHIERHYPMASVIFREEVDVGTGKRRRASPAELVDLSRKERAKKLDGRDY